MSSTKENRLYYDNNANDDDHDDDGDVIDILVYRQMCIV